MFSPSPGSSSREEGEGGKGGKGGGGKKHRFPPGTEEETTGHHRLPNEWSSRRKRGKGNFRREGADRFFYHPGEERKGREGWGKTTDPPSSFSFRHRRGKPWETSSLSRRDKILLVRRGRGDTRGGGEAGKNTSFTLVPAKRGGRIRKRGGRGKREIHDFLSAGGTSALLKGGGERERTRKGRKREVGTADGQRRKEF